jgi:hypothetical protein
MCENKIIYVICEGRSEEAYLASMNLFFRDNNINIRFAARPTYTGHFNAIKKKLQDFGLLKKRKKTEIDLTVIVWIDWDIYERNEQSNKDKYNEFLQKYCMSCFKFNYFSFEDFLILHNDIEIVKQWYELCRKEGHFNGKPIRSDVCEKLIERIIPNYKKGQLPHSFITNESLRNAFENNAKYFFRSDIVDFLKPILDGILYP